MDITPFTPGAASSAAATPAPHDTHDTAGAGAASPPPGGTEGPGLGRRPVPSSTRAPQAAPGSPVLQALQRGDQQTLRALYDQEAAGRHPVDMWRHAADRGRHDLQHAVLALYPHHNIEVKLAHTARPAPTAPGPIPLNGELHRPLATNAHDALVNHVKQVPYFSEKPQRLTDDNLNGQVLFADSGPHGPALIYCRHLASLWALQVVATGKPDYAAFRSPAALQRHVPFTMEALYDRLQTTAAENHLVPLADWGPFVARELQALAARGAPARRVMLVTSGSHVMAMALQVKPAAEGPRYVASFYDPSVTATHKRIASGDLRRFETLRMDQLFVRPHVRDAYFGNESVAGVIVVPPGGEAALPPPQPGGDPQRRLAGPLPALDESVMHHLMAGGFAGTLRDIAPQFAALAKQSPYTAGSLLAGRSNDVPGLFSAAITGQAQVVHAYRALIELVPPTRHEWLLSARSTRNIPALRAAAGLCNQAPTVRAFMDCVATLGLAPAVQLKLLAAQPSPKEIPVLGLAMGMGHLESVNAYLDGLAANTSLSAADQVALLSMGNEQGWPVLAYGLLHGTPETVAAVTGWIAGREFGAGERRELLLARDRAGTPALVHALQHEAADNLQAYVTAVLAAPLDEVDQLAVLTAARAAAAAGPSASPARDAYRDAVRRSALSPAAKNDLLDEDR